MNEIFLSYARADKKRVAPLAASLEASGFSVWWDSRIGSGDDFTKDIEAALESAQAVIVCWSDSANESHWVRDEASYARDHLSLIPISLDGHEPPLGFRQVQATDFSSWPADPEPWNQLLAALEKRGVGKVDPDAQIVAPAPRPAAKRPAWHFAAATAILIALLGAGWAAMSSGTFGEDSEVAQGTKLAVLPFRALSSGEDDAFFAEGLTSEISARLRALTELSLVDNRAGAFLASEDRSLADAASEMGVSHILEGDIRRSDDTMRITARLLRPATSETLWQGEYDATLDDVIEVQSDIAEAVAETLDVLLDDAKRQVMANQGIRNPEAFVAFAKGNRILEDAHSDGDYLRLAEANVHYDRAFELEPGLWRAKLLSMDHFGHQIIDYGEGNPGLSKAEAQEVQRELQRRARLVRLAQPPGEAPEAELIATATSNNWSGLKPILEAMAKIDCPEPGWANDLAAPHGMDERYEQVALREVECNPGATSAYRNLVYMYLTQGDPEKALEFADKTIEIGGTGAINELHRMVALIGLGRIPQARQALSRISVDEDEYLLASALLNNFLSPGQQVPLDAKKLAAMDNYNKLRIAVWRGDQQTANALAAMMDDRLAGPFALAVLSSECWCGAPFDPAVAPNFIARMKEAGLTWPPADPLGIRQIHPLKPTQ